MDNASLEKLKAAVDPDLLLVSLGFTIHYSNDVEVRCSCQLHGGDNPTAFSLKKESHRFCCYTHGCEVNESGKVDNDVIALVMRSNKCTFVEAVKYLCDLTGLSVDFSSSNTDEYTKYKKQKEKDSFVRFMEDENLLPEIDKGIIDKYIANGADYFKSIGIPDTIIRDYGLGSGYDSKGVCRGMIPIYDEYGRVVGLSGRRTDNLKASKYLLMENFQKRKVLYNLNNALKFTSLYKQTIIIVEGFKACWHIILSGFPNTVAVMGKSIRPEQVNLLIKHGIFNALLLLDGDEEGQKGMSASIKLLEKGKIKTLPIVLPDEKSPDDFNYEDTNGLISMFYDSIEGGA